MSAHAMDEMAEDDLDIEDVEWAIRNGQLIRTEKDDPRGTRYVIEGVGVDGITSVCVVGRFASTERFLIVTVYEVTES